MPLTDPTIPRTDALVSASIRHRIVHRLTILVGFLPAVLAAQQAIPATPQESIKMDFGDKPAPAPVEAPATATQLTPNPAPASSRDEVPLGLTANFVGQGPLEGIPFVWSPTLNGWRSFAPYTNAGGTKPSNAEIEQLSTSLYTAGLILPQFQLRLDEQQHLLISGGLPRWSFKWDQNAKGWVSNRRVGAQLGSANEQDSLIRTWIKASAFPKGSGYHINSEGKIVVTPP